MSGDWLAQKVAQHPLGPEVNPGLPRRLEIAAAARFPGIARLDIVPNELRSGIGTRAQCRARHVPMEGLSPARVGVNPTPTKTFDRPSRNWMKQAPGDRSDLVEEGKSGIGLTAIDCPGLDE